MLLNSRLLNRMVSFVTGARARARKKVHDRQLKLMVQTLALQLPENLELEARVERVRKLLSPPKGLRLPMRWVGPPRDGGYPILNQAFGLQKPWVLSVGVGDEVGADLDLARQGHRVHLFDPTIDHPPRRHRNFSFHPIGLGDGENFGSLAHLVELTGEALLERPLLFIDVEGDEWDALSRTSTDLLGAFDQIVVEFHGLQQLLSSARGRLMEKALSNLTANHQPLFLRANNLGALLPIGGVWFPEIVEVTFVHRNLVPGNHELRGRNRDFPPSSRGIRRIDNAEVLRIFRL